MSAKEYSEWIAYHSLYPLDGTREDLRHAILCQLTSNIWGATSDLEDWIPNFSPEEKPSQSPNTVDAYFLHLYKQQERLKQH